MFTTGCLPVNGYDCDYKIASARTIAYGDKRDHGDDSESSIGRTRLAQQISRHLLMQSSRMLSSGGAFDAFPEAGKHFANADVWIHPARYRNNTSMVTVKSTQ